MASPAPDPDRRNTATADTPAGVARAKIVSSARALSIAAQPYRATPRLVPLDARRGWAALSVVSLLDG
jgi:hypothetical protein